MVLHGAISLARRSWQRCREAGFDFYHGVETRRPIDVSRLARARADSESYSPVDGRRLARVLRSLAVGRDDVFLDLGCGKGRALLVAGGEPFAKLIGVEIEPGLAELARRNLSRAGESDFEIHVADAATYEIGPDVTFVFYFNPFGGATFEASLRRVRASFEARPRLMKLIYFEPVAREQVLELLGPGIRVRESGHGYVVYELAPGSLPIRVAEPPAEMVSLSFLAFVATMGFAVPSTPLGPYVQWSDVVMLVCAVASAILMPTRLARELRRPAVWCALGFAAWTGASALASGSGGLYALGALELVAVFVIASVLADGERFVARALRVWCVSAALMAVLGFIGLSLDALGIDTALAGYGGAFGSFAKRLTGPCVSPNMLASLCLVPWLSLQRLKGQRLFSERVRRGLVWFFSVALLFTLSRALISLACGVWTLRLIGSRRGKRVAEYVAGLALLVLVVFISVRFQWVTPEQGLAPGLEPSMRWKLLPQALDVALAHPLFGKGPGLRVAFLADFPLPGTPLWGWDAHCTPLAIAATLGLPALLLFAGLLYAVVRGTLKRAMASEVGAVLVAGFAALAFDSLTTDSQRLRHLWLVLGLLAALRAPRATDKP